MSEKIVLSKAEKRAARAGRQCFARTLLFPEEHAKLRQLSKSRLQTVNVFLRSLILDALNEEVR